MKKNIFMLTVMLFVIAALPVFCQVDLDQGLVAYYPLNGNGNDAGPNGYNTNTSNTPDPIADRNGNPGMAMNFNGTSDNYYTGNQAFTGLNNFTVSVWFNTSVIASQLMVSKHSGSTSGEWYFGMVNNGDIRFTHLTTNGNRVDLNVAYPYNDGQWHHGVAVYDGSRMEIFIDGVSIGSQARSGSTKKHNDVDFHIGNYAGTGWYFNGMLDEVHIYNRALNEDEILALGRDTKIETGSVSGTSFCQGDAIDVPFTVTGTALETDNEFIAYLSDATGSFKNKTNIGTLTGSGSGTINAELPDNLPAGTAYRVMVVSSDQPLAAITDNGAALTVTDPLDGQIGLYNNLFGYFPFNGNTKDSSKYNRDMGIAGNVTDMEDPFGRPGHAKNLDGGYMNWGEIGEIMHAGGQTEMSITMWLSPNISTSQWVYVANNWNNTHGGILVGINPSTKGIRWRVNNEYHVDAPALALNKWVHVACVFGSGQLRIYYDGELAATASSPSGIDGIHQNFLIGRLSAGTSDVHYKGGIDDLRFFKGELNANEVKAVYHNGLAFNNSGLCTGETLKLSTITIPGATYSWTGPNGFSSTDQNPSIPNVTSAHAGLYTLVIDNKGCTHTSVADILVNTELDAVSASNNGPLCEEEDLELTSTTITGATYSWSGPNGFTSTDQNPFIEAAASNASGTYTVSLTKGNCTKDASTIVVVHPTPATPAAGSNSPVCEGGVISLVASAVTDATYSWSGPDGFTSTDQNPTLNNAAADMAGNYIVKTIVNGCESITDTVAVDVLTVGNITVSNSGPYCEGDDVMLSSGTISGASYSWSGPDGFSSTVQNPVILSVTVAASGSYTVTVSKDGCSKAASTSVDVHGIPSAPVAGNNGPVCEGGKLNLTASTVNNADYFWTGPNGQNSTLQNPAVSVASLDDDGIWSVTATVDGCESAAATTDVTVNSIGAIAASNTGPYCEGNDISLSVTYIAGATYSWSGPEGFSSSDQNPVNSGAVADDAGTYTVTVNDGTCSKETTTDVVIHVVPAVPDITSNSPVCEESTLNLSTPAISGASYSWSGPNGFSSSSRTPSVSNITMAEAGIYSVEVTIGSCSGSNTSSVDVTAKPSTPVAGSNSPVCEGHTLQLTASTIPGATYSWTGPDGFSSIEQNAERTNLGYFQDGNYSVKAVINGCKSDAASVNVSVNGYSGTLTAGNNGPVCSGMSINLSATFLGNTDYSWSGPNGFQSTNRNPFIFSASAAHAGKYIVTATNTLNNCTKTDTTEVILGNNHTPAISYDADDNELSVENNGSMYQWYKDGSPITFATNYFFDLDDSDGGPGQYRVEVSYFGGCSSVSETYYHITTAISNSFDKNSVNVYPNPATSVFYVFLDNAGNKETTVTLQDTYGNEILKKVSGEKEIPVDVSSLASGIYYVQVKSADGNRTTKIVIE